MKISFVDICDTCSIAVIDDFFTQTEIVNVKKELKSLYEVAKLKIFVNSGVSTDDAGTPNQKADSLFLDKIFENNRQASNILSVNRKLFLDLELKNNLINKNLFFTQIYKSTRDKTLVNFYSANCFYKKHHDLTCFTALSFFELETFVGGDLIFSDYDVTVKSIENRVVIFPGFLNHAATEVTHGVRVSMAQLINAE